MDKVQPEKCPEKPRGALDAHAARSRGHALSRDELVDRERANVEQSKQRLDRRVARQHSSRDFETELRELQAHILAMGARPVD